MELKKTAKDEDKSIEMVWATTILRPTSPEKAAG
jgi:hypothetical protein